MGEHDGGGGGGAEKDAPAPGDGYRVEINSLRKILRPIEESVLAARKIKKDWKDMADDINESATFEIVEATRDVLHKWGFGMGRVAEHADEVVQGVRMAIAGYMLADLLRIKDFAPTENNLAKLPWGKHAMEEWKDGSRPKFDPPPQIYQEPWLDGGGSGSGSGGSGSGGSGGSYQDVPTNPRYRVDNGGEWVTDGGDKTPIA